jgi:hypothetical protein
MASIALSWHDAAGLFLVEGGRLVGGLKGRQPLLFPDDQLERLTY